MSMGGMILEVPFEHKRIKYKGRKSRKIVIIVVLTSTDSCCASDISF